MEKIERKDKKEQSPIFETTRNKRTEEKEKVCGDSGDQSRPRRILIRRNGWVSKDGVDG